MNKETQEPSNKTFSVWHVELEGNIGVKRKKTKGPIMLSLRAKFNRAITIIIIIIFF